LKVDGLLLLQNFNLSDENGAEKPEAATAKSAEREQKEAQIDRKALSDMLKLESKEAQNEKESWNFSYDLRCLARRGSRARTYFKSRVCKHKEN
jgi:hypothetical protein